MGFRRSMRGFPGIAALVCLAMHAVCGGEAWTQRQKQIEGQIAETKALLADTTNQAERVQWQQRLDLLEQDRRNLEQRAALDRKEQQLAVLQKQHAVNNLREALRAVDPDLTAPARETQRLEKSIRELRGTRAELEQNRQASGGASTNTEQVAEADQHLRAVDEEILARTLERETSERRIHLVTEVKRIEDSLQTLSANSQPTLQILREKRQQIGATLKRMADTADLVALDRARREEIAAALTLSQERLAHADAELALLDKKTQGVKGWLKARPQFYVANMERKYRTERLTAQQQQLAAIEEISGLDAQLRDLYEREATFLNEDLAALDARYRQRLILPAYAIAAILAGYLILSQLLLRIFCPKETRIVARRLSSYLAALLVIVVLVLFFFEDLRSVATILGIASAAVVIALQDMCSAFAGWFVIMASRKFAVGHRVEIDEQRGDVIDIQLLRTTLLEVNNWLGVDEPTGRILIIPNSFVFKSKVFNYNYIHPYAWNKLDITVTYETPSQEAKALLFRILEEETREQFQEARVAGAAMERRYGVPDSNYEPKLFSVIADSGILFRLVYVAHYRHMSSTRNRLNERIIREFERDPRMQLAYPTERQIQEQEKPPVRAAPAPKA